MPIDLNGYNVVHENRVYRALAIVVMDWPEETTPEEPERITVLVINENGNIMHINDMTKRFQFVPILQE